MPILYISRMFKIEISLNSIYIDIVAINIYLKILLLIRNNKYFTSILVNWFGKPIYSLQKVSSK